MQVRTTWTNKNPNTIYNRLAARLGREPTDAEVRAELNRIMTEARVAMAEQGKLPHQRKR